MVLLETFKLLKDMGFLWQQDSSKSDRRRMQRFFLTTCLTATRRCWLDADFLPPFACAERGRVLAPEDAAQELLKPENA